MMRGRLHKIGHLRRMQARELRMRNQPRVDADNPVPAVQPLTVTSQLGARGARRDRTSRLEDHLPAWDLSANERGTVIPQVVTVPGHRHPAADRTLKNAGKTREYVGIRSPVAGRTVELSLLARRDAPDHIQLGASPDETSKA